MLHTQVVIMYEIPISLIIVNNPYTWGKYVWNNSLFNVHISYYKFTDPLSEGVKKLVYYRLEFINSICCRYGTRMYIYYLPTLNQFFFNLIYACALRISLLISAQ